MAGELEELADKLEAEWYANARPKSRPRKRQRDAVEKLMEAESDERTQPDSPPRRGESVEGH